MYMYLRAVSRVVWSSCCDTTRHTDTRHVWALSVRAYGRQASSSRLVRMRTMASDAATLPHFAAGTIVEGFGRGSQSLGIPTANFAQDVVDNLPANFPPGIYYGWASIDGNVYKGVLSIGWNPFYKNEKKSMETHILHKFPGPLHGKQLRVIVTGFIRPEMDFASVEDLIKEINNDIAIAKESLDDPAMLRYKDNEFLTTRDRKSP